MSRHLFSLENTTRIYFSLLILMYDTLNLNLGHYIGTLCSTLNFSNALVIPSTLNIGGKIVLSIRVFLTVNWVFTSSYLNQGFICLSKYVGPSSYWIINNWLRKLYMYILHCFCREQTFLLRWYKCVSQEHAVYATVSVIDVASVTTFI